jgi:hypothetical protein
VPGNADDADSWGNGIVNGWTEAKVAAVDVDEDDLGGQIVCLGNSWRSMSGWSGRVFIRYSWTALCVSESLMATYRYLTPLLPPSSPRPLTNTSPRIARPEKKLAESGRGATRICGCDAAYTGGAWADISLA